MFQFAILLIFVLLVSVEGQGSQELPRCAGIITSIELSSGADARGSYTFVKLKDHLHEMWTELERLRMPIILAYYKKFHVIIHSAYCHKEEYKFEVITFVRYDYEFSLIPINPLLLYRGIPTECTGRITQLELKYETELKRYRIYLEIDTLMGTLYSNVLQLWEPLRSAFMREAEIQFPIAECKNYSAFAGLTYMDRGHN